MFDLKAFIVREIEAAGGRHDEPEIYDGPPGDPGIGGGPGSISWEINGDLASLVVGGTAAIIMEVLHPSVMAGVFTQSSYRTEPERRARNTLGYVLRTTFGSTSAATRRDRAGEAHPRPRRRGARRRRRLPGARSRAHRLGPHLHPVGGDARVRDLQSSALRRGEEPLSHRAGRDRPHGRRGRRARDGRASSTPTSSACAR